MGFYVESNNNYYEGDKQFSTDLDVPRRPDSDYVWNGTWVLDEDKATLKFESSIQNYLNSEARAKGYDDIVSACSYAATTNAFQNESISFLNWRAAVWDYCYQLLANIKEGTAQIPTFEALISALPKRT